MSHLFDSFRIGQFRGFKDVELTDCGAVNLLIGANNSGKTSILEALALYARPFDQKEWLDVLERRESKSGRNARVEDFRWLFPAGLSIELEATGKCEVARVTARVSISKHVYLATDEEKENATSDVNAPIPVVRIDVEARAAKQPDIPVRDYFRFTSRGFAYWPERPFSLEVESLTPFSHRIDPLQLKGLSEATQQGWKDDILVLLRQIDPAIEDLEILAPDGQTPALHVQYKGVGLAPLSTLGDGLRRIISIALAIGNLKNGLLLIDEIESAVHVSALATVFPWLTAACKRNNVQLFATTHSLEALDALLETPEASDLVCYRLNRPDQPERIQRIAPDLLRRLRFDRGLDVR